MAEEIVIDKSTFFNRLSSFYNAWKADKRSSHANFGGVSSIVILMGKTDEANSFQKNNAMHVCLSLPLNPILVGSPAIINSSGSLAMNFPLRFLFLRRRWCMW